jgi:hypothetical protein
MKTVAALFCALALAGCMNAGDFAGRAVEHNKAIAEAADKVMLLNIVRASQRRPIVYAQFKGVSESFNRGLSVSANAPFGADAASIVNTGLNIGPSQFVSLSTSPLDDQDFYQGVMRPVQAGLLAYYLENGWPRDLIFTLMIERFDIGAPFYARVVDQSETMCARFGSAMAVACSRLLPGGGARSGGEIAEGRLVFENDPRDPEKLAAWHDLSLRLQILGLKVDSAPVTRELRLPAAGFSAGAADIKSLTDQGAEITRDGQDYLIRTVSWSTGFKLGILGLRGPAQVSIEGQGSAAEVDLRARLRSPDSILYFLGELIREDTPDTSVLVGSGDDARFVPLIAVAGCSGAVIETDFEGSCYGVPSDGDHRSTQVIALLHQIFGLNKRASEAPTAGVIRVVN